MEAEAHTARPADDAVEAAVLMGAVLTLAIADFRASTGADPDGSETVDHIIGRVGEMAFMAPAIRFRDSAAAADPAAAQLHAMHRRLKAVAPVLARLTARR